jgi:hypothetical protein
VVVQLAVMVCINWAAATAALLVVTPLLCLARPQPQPHPQPQPPLLSTRVPKPPKVLAVEPVSAIGYVDLVPMSP